MLNKAIDPNTTLASDLAEQGAASPAFFGSIPAAHHSLDDITGKSIHHSRPRRPPTPPKAWSQRQQMEVPLFALGASHRVPDVRAFGTIDLDPSNPVSSTTDEYRVMNGARAGTNFNPALSEFLEGLDNDTIAGMAFDRSSDFSLSPDRPHPQTPLYYGSSPAPSAGSPTPFVIPSPSHPGISCLTEATGPGADAADELAARSLPGPSSLLEQFMAAGQFQPVPVPSGPSASNPDPFGGHAIAVPSATLIQKSSQPATRSPASQSPAKGPGGRRSKTELEHCRAHYAVITRTFQDLAVVTNRSVAKLKDLYFAGGKGIRATSLWNFYQAYFVKHRQDELDRCGLEEGRDIDCWPSFQEAFGADTEAFLRTALELDRLVNQKETIQQRQRTFSKFCSKLDKVVNEGPENHFQVFAIAVGDCIEEDRGLGSVLFTGGLSEFPKRLRTGEETLLALAKCVAYDAVAEKVIDDMDTIRLVDEVNESLNTIQAKLQDVANDDGGEDEPDAGGAESDLDVFTSCKRHILNLFKSAAEASGVPWTTDRCPFTRLHIHLTSLSHVLIGWPPSCPFPHEVRRPARNGLKDLGAKKARLLLAALEGGSIKLVKTDLDKIKSDTTPIMSTSKPTVFDERGARERLYFASGKVLQGAGVPEDLAVTRVKRHMTKVASRAESPSKIDLALSSATASPSATIHRLQEPVDSADSKPAISSLESLTLKGRSVAAKAPAAESRRRSSKTTSIVSISSDEDDPTVSMPPEVVPHPRRPAPRPVLKKSQGPDPAPAVPGCTNSSSESQVPALPSVPSEQLHPAPRGTKKRVAFAPPEKAEPPSRDAKKRRLTPPDEGSGDDHTQDTFNPPSDVRIASRHTRSTKAAAKPKLRTPPARSTKSTSKPRSKSTISKSTRSASRALKLTLEAAEAIGTSGDSAEPPNPSDPRLPSPRKPKTGMDLVDKILESRQQEAGPRTTATGSAGNPTIHDSPAAAHPRPRSDLQAGATLTAEGEPYFANGFHGAPFSVDNADFAMLPVPYPNYPPSNYASLPPHHGDAPPRGPPMYSGAHSYHRAYPLPPQGSSRTHPNFNYPPPYGASQGPMMASQLAGPSQPGPQHWNRAHFSEEQQ
ncbi:hypothetical protein H0H92_004464 [Tricholoma furcatifolium]|nr:hypothetical protein H0H92_004464 [Tricholoma furcatifolium]